MAQESQGISWQTKEEIPLPGAVSPCEEEWGVHMTGSYESKDTSFSGGAVLCGAPRRILRNIVCLSVAFTLSQSAFLATANLQSTLYDMRSPGVIGIAACKLTVIVTSVFLPQFLIEWLTVKRTICVCMIGRVVFIVAQVSRSLYALVPAGVAMGLCEAPLWVALCTYVTHVATVYANTLGQDRTHSITLFFSILFLFFNSSHVWGNIITSAVLNKEEDASSSYRCGYRNCSTPAHTQLVYSVHSGDTFVLWSVNVISVFAAALLVAINVDPLTRYGEVKCKKKLSKVHVQKMLGGVFRHAGHRYSLLLMPLTFWSGYQHVYILLDFTQSIVSCALGPSHIGSVLIVFGLLGAFSSMSVVSITALTGRLSLITACVFLMLGLFIAIAVNDPIKPILVYAVAGGWGVAHAIWNSQLHAIYGIVFENTRMAFTGYKINESIGMLISIITGPQMCLYTEVPIFSTFLLLSLCFYYIFELLEHKKNKRSRNMDQISINEVNQITSFDSRDDEIRRITRYYKSISDDSEGKSSSVSTYTGTQIPLSTKQAAIVKPRSSRKGQPNKGGSPNKSLNAIQMETITRSGNNDTSSPSNISKASSSRHQTVNRAWTTQEKNYPTTSPTKPSATTKHVRTNKPSYSKPQAKVGQTSRAGSPQLKNVGSSPSNTSTNKQLTNTSTSSITPLQTSAHSNITSTSSTSRNMRDFQS